LENRKPGKDGPITHDPADSKADKPGEKKGADDAKGKSEALGAAASAAGAAAKGVGVLATAGSGGGAGVQKVSVVSAPATLQTHVTKGKVTVSEPVGVQNEGGDPLPVMNQGTQAVTVLNSPLHVAFGMISFSSLFKTPDFFGFLPSGITGITVGAAFEKGGYVPFTGPALVHAGEFVIPADAVRAIGARGGGFDGNGGLSKLVNALTGGVVEGVEASKAQLVSPAGGALRIGGPDLRVPGAPRLADTAASAASDTSEPAAPAVILNYSAWDVPTGREQLDKHSRHIAGMVAKEWAARPSPRSRP
jgi:hypothetical protein